MLASSQPLLTTPENLSKKKMQLQSNANDDEPIANHLPLAIVDDVITTLNRCLPVSLVV